MDSFSIHLAPLPRAFRAAPVVHTVGYIPHKTSWVRHAFSTLNFSFVLRGRGEYRVGRETYPVRGPCVITQWPGIHVEYGPDREWEELYVIYAADCVHEFGRGGLARPERPVWTIKDPGPVRRAIGELRAAMADLGRYDADRADYAAKKAVMESVISAEAPMAGEEELGLRATRAYVEEHCTDELDFDRLARAHGFSPTTFRRRWQEAVGMPPGRYVTELRIRLARRLLVETSLSVGEIAARVGYEDPLYFSRRFRRATGRKATAYRARHRHPLSLRDADGGVGPSVAWTPLPGVEYRR